MSTNNNDAQHILEMLVENLSSLIEQVKKKINIDKHDEDDLENSINKIASNIGVKISSLASFKLNLFENLYIPLLKHQGPILLNLITNLINIKVKSKEDAERKFVQLIRAEEMLNQYMDNVTDLTKMTTKQQMSSKYNSQPDTFAVLNSFQKEMRHLTSEFEIDPNTLQVKINQYSVTDAAHRQYLIDIETDHSLSADGIPIIGQIMSIHRALTNDPVVNQELSKVNHILEKDINLEWSTYYLNKFIKHIIKLQDDSKTQAKHKLNKMDMFMQLLANLIEASKNIDINEYDVGIIMALEANYALLYRIEQELINKFNLHDEFTIPFISDLGQAPYRLLHNNRMKNTKALVSFVHIFGKVTIKVLRFINLYSYVELGL